MQEKQYYTYIVTNKRNGTLYIGVTSDLIKRVWEHKNKVVKGFSQEYGLDKLVYYEVSSDVKASIEREKELKRFRRKWKLELIEDFNPHWRDLFEDICG